ncbi:MAG TPA: cell division protein ZapD [Thiotrichales bacterium]|nr:cell division protein ZapD [Thiotrichales bacterium]
MQKQLLFEFPLNERIRAFLRLELLFRQARHFAAEPAPWCSRAALDTLHQILELLGRADLKTELIKEMERHTATLEGLRDKKGVDGARLEAILSELDRLQDHLHANAQGFCTELRNNEFLNAVRNRSAIPGGTSSFDLPGYHHWLQQPPARRNEDLAYWLHEVEPLNESLVLVLRLLRESALPRQVVAEGGLYHHTMDEAPWRLLRIYLPPDSPLFPEVSGGKHRFTIRFLTATTAGDKPKAVKSDVTFALAGCGFY